MKPTAVAKISTLFALGAMLVAPRGSLGQQSSADLGDSSQNEPLGGQGGASSGGGGGGGRSGASSASDTNSTDVVYCNENGTSAHYVEFFSGSRSETMRYCVSDTGCSNHVNWKLNPNTAQYKPVNESIPAYPMKFESGGTTDLSSTANAIGTMLNGVGMFSPWAKVQVVDYEDTAFYIEGFSLDACGGHATEDGTYHYHAVAGCLQEQAMVHAGTEADQHSALLGWAFDGFPIYGQLGPDGVEMKMCGVEDADDTHCLDACSGYEALVPSADDFTYRYYTSCGFNESFFPFTVNCFRGCCPDGVTCNQKVESCGDSPESGYTSDYVPMVADSLDEPYDTELLAGDDADYIGTSYSVNCSLFMGSSTSSPPPSPAHDNTSVAIQPDDSSTSTDPTTPAPTAPPATAPTPPPTAAPSTPPTTAPSPPPTTTAPTTTAPTAPSTTAPAALPTTASTPPHATSRTAPPIASPEETVTPTAVDPQPSPIEGRIPDLSPSPHPSSTEGRIHTPEVAQPPAPEMDLPPATTPTPLSTARPTAGGKKDRDAEPSPSPTPEAAGGVVTTIEQTASDDGFFGDDVVEAAAKTTIHVVASAYDARQGHGSRDGVGCGEGGCLPSLTRDGIVADQESRWSCKKDLVPNQGGCEIEFTFGRPQDLVGVQIAFWKADERDRWLKVKVNGEIIETIESYAGPTFGSFPIEQPAVKSVRLGSVGIQNDEWISLLEVGDGKKVAACSATLAC